MTDRLRVFLALPLPAAASRSCEALLAPVRSAHPAARWVGRDSLHVTLVFLGAVDVDSVGGIAAAMDRVASAVAAFHAALGRGGGRARRGSDGIAWLEMSEGGPLVRRLAAQLEVAMGEPGSEDRPSGQRPHVTVARRASPELIDAIAHVAAASQPVRWRVDRIVLFRSHLEPGAARYESLHVARLGDHVSRR